MQQRRNVGSNAPSASQVLQGLLYAAMSLASPFALIAVVWLGFNTLMH